MFGDLNGYLTTYDMNSSQYLEIFKGHSSAICSIVFSSEGNEFATGSYDGTIKLWDFETKQCKKSIEQFRVSRLYLDFSPCGKKIIYTS